MGSHARLSRPPIIEAILIIEYDASDTLEHRQVNAFHDQINDRYPERSARPITRANWTAPDRPVSIQSVSPQLTGHLFFDTEHLHVVQLSDEGFMFHQIRDYTTFEHFGTEARRLWELFATMRSPRTINRLSLRYINDIHFPEEAAFANLSRYMQISPTIPAKMEAALLNGLLRIGLEDHSIPAYGVVTQTWSRSDSGALTLILDMEASAKGPHDSEPESLWGTFQRLRDLKNQLFLSSITDTTRSFFE